MVGLAGFESVLGLEVEEGWPQLSLGRFGISLVRSDEAHIGCRNMKTPVSPGPQPFGAIWVKSTTNPDFCDSALGGSPVQLVVTELETRTWEPTP